MRNDSMFNQYIPNILIVDDVPANLKILGEILKNQGFKIRPVPNGKLALQVIEKEKPDLILLDIMMPEIDGFEVCRNLKENPEFDDIPIIFISALNDTENIVKALKSGGVDYVTKPFHAEEVIARVNTHLKIRLQNLELHKLNTEKDKFFSIIAHDLRGPIGGFMGFTELMMDSSSFSENELNEMLTELNNSAKNIYNLLDNLLEWSLMQRGKIPFDLQMYLLQDIINESVNSVFDLAKNKLIHLDVTIMPELQVFADANMLKTIIRNLLANAIKFTPKEGKINVSAIKENNNIIVKVTDTGIGMSNELINNIFRTDVNSSRPGTEGEPSTGLGLLLCKEFVEKHNGKIWAESEEGKGSCFYITIPQST